MKPLAALLFAGCLALPAFGQQLTLNGSLTTDAKAPVPATRISVHGLENTTDSQGQFKLVLSGDFSEGERVIIKVIKPGWVINHPLDGEWNLPNVKLQNIQTLNVIIVPRGSPKLWTHARIEKQIARLSDEIARLKKEGDTPRPIDFSFYLREWAEQYGFTPEQVKTAFDEWAKAVEKSADYRTLGLRAFYQNNFPLAAANFVKAAQKDEGQIKPVQEQLDRKILSAYQNRKDAGNSFKNSYQFREALEQYDLAKLRLAELISKDKHRYEQAEVEALHGVAKVELGIRVEGEEGNRLLAEAVDSFKRAFAVFTREQLPQPWAMTQNNLGAALRSQGERMAGGEGVKLLAEAVIAFRNALSVFTREQSPQQWAIPQNYLGTALRFQGERTAGDESMKLLTEAVAAFRNALLIYTSEQLPLQWAATQNNLGAALLRQGERMAGDEGVKLLAEAVAAYRNTLLVYTREQLPQGWATTQNNLGAVLSLQGMRMAGDESVKLLVEAVTAYRNALLVRTRERLPQDWAVTQNNLGETLRAQGERTASDEGMKLLAEAVAAFHNALLVRTREQLPQDWAGTQNNLGAALVRQSERMAGDEGVKLLAEAVAAFRNALQVYTREQLPQLWATTQNNLAAVLRLQGERTAGNESMKLLTEAIATYRTILLVYPREQLPQQWALTQNNLGNALRSQGERTEGADRERLLRESVNALQLALQVRDRRYLPLAWAQTQGNLAGAYYALQDWSNAAECYANVLTLYPGYKQGFQRASSLYHETLFRFAAAFELNRRWLEANPNDLSVLPAFAENHFTTGRFAECRARLTALLAQPELSAGTKLALRLLEIANLLSLGQAEEVPAQLDLLIQAVAAQPADFQLTWTFHGTLHFIGQAEQLLRYRAWLQQLFGAAAHRDRAAILQALRAAQASFKQ